MAVTNSLADCAACAGAKEGIKPSVRASTAAGRGKARINPIFLKTMGREGQDKRKDKSKDKRQDIAPRHGANPARRVARAAARHQIDNTPVFEARRAVAGGFRRLLYAA